MTSQRGIECARNISASFRGLPVGAERRSRRRDPRTPTLPSSLRDLIAESSDLILFWIPVFTGMTMIGHSSAQPRNPVRGQLNRFPRTPSAATQKNRAAPSGGYPISTVSMNFGLTPWDDTPCRSGEPAFFSSRGCIAGGSQHSCHAPHWHDRPTFLASTDLWPFCL